MSVNEAEVRRLAHLLSELIGAESLGAQITLTALGAVVQSAIRAGWSSPADRLAIAKLFAEVLVEGVQRL